jgi:hypothetical protein
MEAWDFADLPGDGFSGAEAGLVAASTDTTGDACASKILINDIPPITVLLICVLEFIGLGSAVHWISV